MLIGAVLCGGASRRMGTDKAFIEIDGVPMVRRAASALAKAGCATIYAVGGDSVRLRRLGFVTLADQYPGEGPLGGIVTALHLAIDPGATVLVTACDMPSLDGDTLAMLASSLGDADVVMAHSDRLEPLCSCWRGEVLDHLRSEFEHGTRAVHEAVASLRLAQVQVDAAVISNLNTPDDLPRRG
jgi:molybdopterin-guanine dinucleotide biosynthesis protein A